MSKIEKAVAFMESVARNDKHGYDQIDRWGNPDYDCSGLVITALEKAGIHVKKYGASYTGNMYTPLIKAGFTNVTSKVSLSTGKGLKRGDVLLKPYGHTAMYCGNGKMVDARINEKGRATGGKDGDQTGREIEIHNYRNHPFVYALRYEESNPTSKETKTTKTEYYKKYTGKSVKIDTVFKAIGVPANYRGSWQKRKAVAEKNGIHAYTGSSTQNIILMNLAKQGKLKK